MKIDNLFVLNPFIIHHSRIEYLHSVLFHGVLSQNILKEKNIKNKNFGPEIQQKQIGEDRISIWAISDNERKSGDGKKWAFDTGKKLKKSERKKAILSVSSIANNNVGIIISKNIGFTHFGYWDYEGFIENKIENKFILSLIFNKANIKDAKKYKEYNIPLFTIDTDTRIIEKII